MLKGPYGFSPLPTFAPKTCAMLGDSIVANGFNRTSQFKVFYGAGFVSWVRFLTRNRLNIGHDQNFGVGGDTLQKISARVPAVIAQRPYMCIVEGGTNDLQASNTFESMRSTMLNAILLPLLSRGITVIAVPITPKNNVAVPTNMKQVGQRYNNWLRSLCYGRGPDAAVVASAARAPVYLADVTRYWTNYSNANGDPLSGFIWDNVHPTAMGSYWLGKAVADVVNQVVPPIDLPIHNGDYYDATYNPTGNILRSGSTNYAALLGTGGTQSASTGFTFSGTGTATGWQMARTSGTSTMVATMTKENPRTDGPNSGERQVIGLQASTVGAADERYVFKLAANPAIPGGDIQRGDTIEGGFSIEVASQTGLVTCELQMNESGGALTQASIDHGYGALDAINWPSQAGEFPIKGTLRCEPITIFSDSTSLAFQLSIRFNASAVSTALSMKVSDPWLRKVPT